MKDKKFQVFVSSTFTDLKEERQAAVEAILSSGHIPAGMELFSAGDESQMSVIERWIDESDIYLLILGGRYGSIENKTGKSYTHLEYDYAVNLGKPLFAVVISDEALERKVKDNGTSVIEQDNNKELKNFRSIVTSNLVKFFEDKKDIKLAIHETLSEFVYRKDLIGWIRGDNSVNTAILAEEIARLTKENFELRASATSISPLYLNLTFEELKELLKKHSVNLEDKQLDLYEYLLNVGSRILEIKEFYKHENIYLRKLEEYSIVKLWGGISGYSFKYKFTEDGHKFYLKALLLDMRELL